MLRKQHSDCLQANEELQRGKNTKESRTTSNKNLKQQHNLLGIHEKHGYHAIVIYLKKDKYESRSLCNHYATPGFAYKNFESDGKRTEDGEKHINTMKAKLEPCRDQSMQLERCWKITQHCVFRAMLFYRELQNSLSISFSKLPCLKKGRVLD